MCFWAFHSNDRTISFAQYSWDFNANVETILFAWCFWALNSIDYFMLVYFNASLCLIIFCLYMISVFLVACLPLAWGFA